MWLGFQLTVYRRREATKWEDIFQNSHIAYGVHLTDSFDEGNSQGL